MSGDDGAETDGGDGAPSDAVNTDQTDDASSFDRRRPGGDDGRSEADTAQRGGDPDRTGGGDGRFEGDDRNLPGTDFDWGPTVSPDSDDDPQSGGVVSRGRSIVRSGFSIGNRSLIDTYLPAIFLVFLIITAAGGLLAYGAETAPETETERQTAGTWSTDARFTHGAVVTTDTPTFSEGQRLQNRSLYFTRLSPILTGEYVLTHRGDTEAASGAVTLRLVFEAVDEGGETAYWRETQPIADVSVESLPPGETRRIPFEVNVSALNGRVAAIEEPLGASPGTTRIAIVAETNLEASVADDRFADTRTDRLAVGPGQGTYSVSPSITQSQTYEATEAVEVPAGPTPLQQYGGPALLAVGLLGCLVTAAVRRTNLFVVTDAERTHLEFSRARSDLDKWISVGAVPPRDERTVVELNTLRDIVDVAIDSDRRVIERPDTTPRYVVLDDTVRYVFDPPDAAFAEDDTTDGDRPHRDTPPTSSHQPDRDSSPEQPPTQLE